MNTFGIIKTIRRWSVIGATGLLLSGCGSRGGEADRIRFYVGSSNGELEYGIYLCEIDLLSNRLSLTDSFPGARIPYYLAFSPEQQYLYSVNKEISDTATGYMKVTSFRVDRRDYSLKVLNSQSSEGSGPCHVYCSMDGRWLFAANYATGNIAVFPLQDDGRIGPASSVVQSTGSGPVEERQEGPHTHYVTLDPDGNFLLSPDLGADRILVFRFDPDSGILTPNPVQPYFALPPGSGPRHLAFHPSGRFVYIANELGGTVTACSYDGKNGVLKALDQVSTLPGSYTGALYPAAIRVHPGGGFLYVSNRGDLNSISVFRIGEDGTITRIQVMENVPAWPRDFNIDPSGKYLLAAGERSDQVRLYLIDPVSGQIRETGQQIRLRNPACILFIE
jgi:6-phosphogluconolactonase